MAKGTLTTTVLVDANVLYSKTLRDWLALCYLQIDGWFEVMWTEDILSEVLYHLRKDKPEAPERAIGGLRDKLAETFSSGRITGYEIKPDESYPADLYDAHVHAAAIHAEVDFVLTADKGFEDLEEDLDGLPYEVHCPDSFFCLLDDSSPQAIQAVLLQQLEYWTTRQRPFNLVTQLERAGAPEFAKRIRRYLQECEIPGPGPVPPTRVDYSWSAIEREAGRRLGGDA